MALDELKLILEVVSQVTGDAKTVAIAWIVAGALKSLVGWGVLCALIVFIVRSITNAVAQSAGAQATVVEINDLLGQPGSSFVCYAHEYRAVTEAVRELKKGAEK